MKTTEIEKELLEFINDSISYHQYELMSLKKQKESILVDVFKRENKIDVGTELIDKRGRMCKVTGFIVPKTFVKVKIVYKHKNGIYGDDESILFSLKNIKILN